MGRPESGERIRFTASTPEGAVTHEGILLAPATSGHITVKLDNCYNITFAESEICEISTIGSAILPDTITNPGISENSDLPEIWILHTGGTIASKVDYETGAVAAPFCLCRGRE